MKRYFANLLLCFMTHLLAGQQQEWVIPPTLQYDEIDAYEHFIIVKAHGKCGIINREGAEMIPLKYNDMDVFNRNPNRPIFRVCLRDSNGTRNYGLIDLQGKIILACEYKMTWDGNGVYSNYSDNSWVIQSNKGKYGLMDTTGKLITPLQYGYAYPLGGGTVVSLNRKSGLIKAGREILPPKYDDIRFGSGDSHVFFQLNGKWGLTDTFGNEIIAAKYKELSIKHYGKQIYVSFEIDDQKGFGLLDKKAGNITKMYDEGDTFYDGIAKVRLKDKWGFIDTLGNLITPIKYSDVESFDKKSGGLAPVCLYENYYRCGFINKKGYEIVPLKYTSAHNFSKGLAAVSNQDQDEKIGFINENGQEAIPFKFDHPRNIPYDSGDYYSFKWGADDIFSKVYLNGKSLFVNKKGNIYDFDECDNWDICATRVKKNNKYGLFNKQGKEIASIKYDSIVVGDEYCWLKLGENWAIIDTNGQKITPFKYENYHYGGIHGLIAVKSKGKWGFITTKGKEIITEQYEDVSIGESDKVGVKLKGKWGIIRNPLLPSQLRKPTILWQSPVSQKLTVEQSTFNISFSIQSNSLSTETQLYVNNQLYKGLGVREKDCQNCFERNVLLKEGENRLIVHATNNAGTTKSEERIIFYKSADAKKQNNYYALMIANNEYQFITDLEKPISDAIQLMSVLKQNYGFATKNIATVYNATREQMIHAFEKMQERMTENDYLLIFYSGHGSFNERNQTAYWIPVDAKVNGHGDKFSASELNDYIRAIQSKHIFVIADACYSGGFLLKSEPQACEILERKLSRRMMSSGEKVEVPDKSVFLKYLLKVLEENQESCLSASALFNKLKEPVILNSPMHQIPQYGIISQTGDEGGDFIFKKQ